MRMGSQWLTSRQPSTVVVAAATGAPAATNEPIIAVSTMPTPPGVRGSEAASCAMT